MKKRLLIAFGILLSLMLVACSNDSSDGSEAKDTKEKVHEYSVGSFEDDVTASITSHELIVNDNGKETTFDLPSDEFFVSIAPFVENPEDNRIYFYNLKQLFVDINQKNIDNVCMDILSMGMTNDYEIAIEEGATHIRVGTGIFGERIYQ